eukprot:CAMPEP_0179243866 /NCGR_PEP_ID=MMETSP0797-20121207/17764_1 /TAXON_ID=47934 /ORGANISM="Dinophysis acuminata, Strain DAEP01" /LENGTH=65 /DNA_ID=CAMNT_0020951367 /DNA_START=165 /DNA_END=358 /DNA_ORIENTATION=+
MQCIHKPASAAVTALLKLALISGGIWVQLRAATARQRHAPGVRWRWCAIPDLAETPPARTPAHDD